MSKTFKFGEGAAHGRLDVFLAHKLGVSRTAVQRSIKSGLIAVNGVHERASYILVPTDIVQVLPDTSVDPERPAVDLPVVYEDDDLVIVNKPAGIAVHAGNGRRLEPTVADFARTITTDTDPERAGIVHRLDRETSGLLVIAKSAAAKETLQAEWKLRRVKKTYLALLIGHISPDKAVIRLPLDRDPAYPTRRHVSPSGKMAVTRYEKLLEFPGYSYVEARPETGRTHQLRVHFAALGHAVAGDIVYGPKKRPLGLTRQFLHAAALSFVSPSGKPIDIEVPLPTDLQSILEELQNAIY